MAKRSSTGAIVCPRCGVPSAKVIGRSESLPVIYLRCDDCGRTSISPEETLAVRRGAGTPRPLPPEFVPSSSGFPRSTLSLRRHEMPVAP